VFRFYEAAVRDLRQSAISRPWRLHLNFSCQVESNGWFSAIKLIARISGPGHKLTFGLMSYGGKGVKTPEKLRFLREDGREPVQGYGFSRPDRNGR
jgi:hypothetical protein